MSCSPFPGMDPYLESPNLRPDAHNRRLREGEQRVTVLEMLAPVHKRPGEGRQAHLDKRAALLESSVHLVEIDLLRQGPRMPLEDTLSPADYLVVVSKASERPVGDVRPLGLRQPLPVLPIPLLPPDPDIPLDLGQALHTAYARARYDLRIDYTQPPAPALLPEDTAWATALLAQAGIVSNGERTS